MFLTPLTFSVHSSKVKNYNFKKPQEKSKVSFGSLGVLTEGLSSGAFPQIMRYCRRDGSTILTKHYNIEGQLEKIVRQRKDGSTYSIADFNVVTGYICRMFKFKKNGKRVITTYSANGNVIDTSIDYR